MIDSKIIIQFLLNYRKLKIENFGVIRLYKVTAKIDDEGTIQPQFKVTFEHNEMTEADVFFKEFLSNNTSEKRDSNITYEEFCSEIKSNVHKDRFYKIENLCEWKDENNTLLFTIDSNLNSILIFGLGDTQTQDTNEEEIKENTEIKKEEKYRSSNLEESLQATLKEQEEKLGIEKKEEKQEITIEKEEIKIEVKDNKTNQTTTEKVETKTLSAELEVKSIEELEKRGKESPKTNEQKPNIVQSQQTKDNTSTLGKEEELEIFMKREKSNRRRKKKGNISIALSISLVVVIILCILGFIYVYLYI